jgi:hypothetical protein
MKDERFCDVIVAILRRGSELEQKLIFKNLWSGSVGVIFTEPEWKVFFELLTVCDLSKKVQIMNGIEKKLRGMQSLSAIVEEMVYHLIWCLPLDYRKSFCDRNRGMLRTCGSERITKSMLYMEMIS